MYANVMKKEKKVDVAVKRQRKGIEGDFNPPYSLHDALKFPKKSHTRQLVPRRRASAN